MKKFSKKLSLLMALCMVISIFSGLSVMADDPFALVGYDADSDFVTLDFNQAIDKENASVTLTKGGVNVAFTFNKYDYNSYVQTSGSTYYTYLIKPEGGIELGEEYKLTLSNISNSAGTETLETFEKYFIVNDLGGTFDNYRQGETYVTVSRDETTGTVTANMNGGYINYAKYSAFIGTGVGNDANTTIASGANWTEKDYTFKVKYKKSGLKMDNFYLGITNNLNTHNYKSFVGLHFRAQAQSGGSDRANVNLVEDEDTTSHAYGLSTSSTIGAKLVGGERPTGYSYTTGVEFKLSTKNRIAHVFINGKKTLDIPLTKDWYGFASICVEPVNYTAYSSQSGEFSGTATLTFSDFLATKSAWSDTSSTPLIVGYDADADFISLDFDEPVNFTAENVILSRGGAAVPFTVRSANHANMEAARSERYTYLVVPDSGGFDFDTEYKLTLINVNNLDSENPLTLASWAKTFEVKKLAEGLEIVDGSNVMTYEPRSTHTVSNVNTKDIKLDYTVVSDSGNRAQLYRAVGEDTDSTLSSVSKVSPYTEKDYTVKTTFKNISGTTHANLILGIAYSKDPSYGWDHNYFRGAALKVEVQPKNAGNLSQGIGTYANMAVRNANDTGTAGEIKKIQSAANISGMNVTTGVELKLSTKNKFAHAYINGGKIADMQLLQDYPGHAQIHFLPKNNTVENPATVTIADFLATRSEWKNASPAHAVELADWDADSDFVTLDFNEDVNISAGNVTLTQNGQTIPVTVASANHANMEAANSERYTYLVRPESGGIVLDIPYTINVTGVTAKGFAGSVFEPFTKTFKVEKLAEGLEIVGGSNVMTYEPRSTYTVSNVNTKDIKADYTSASTNRVQLYRAVGQDSDSTLIDNYQNSPYTEKDYTVKTTFKNISGTTHADIVLAIAYNHNASYGFSHEWFRGAALRVDVQPKKDGEPSQGPGSKANMTVRNANNTTGAVSKVQSAANISGMNTTTGVELKLSTKNKFARAYINGGKIADMQLLQDYAGHAQIHFSPRQSTSEYLATVTIADFLATRAVEVTEEFDEFSVDELSVTANNEAVESLEGKTQVNISTELTNNTVSAKNVFIVCSLYASNGEMKNCIVSPVKSAVSGKTDIVFENVDVNGAEKIKLFVWDGTDSLYAYFPALIFPEE